ncbi:TetR/AcrR family transcriptional regulator [Nocardia sp. CDC159]|uniref:TetR/AcrR family transcriptional regulator n=1 Tax=Nocardia pulmonis TaxID=2951408 RepID=A0A9X2IXH3_9NOCA|nr:MULTISPECIES: TetR/AcrR family transcriptional regulator [Nocardia]MCM6772871.1 TetR/AcrR family transcriptional regulator [Nocardia pulmonis]MCM6785826.1 TetR/AcrR family transcriptional regulator [Nocardia sp. CDC159]
MATSTEADQPIAQRGMRMTRRRAETRQRLLNAAFDAFAAEGFGRCTVEQICERAGFTRGAFYSNFTSLEELFLTMWEQRSQHMLREVTALLEEAPAAAVTDLRHGVEWVLRAVPLDDRWIRITYEFTAHALRNPGLRRTMAAREEAIIAALLPLIEGLLRLVGRRVTDPAALGRALVAVHDGTATQCLLEPDSTVALEQRVDLFHHVVLAYSEPC